MNHAQLYFKIAACLYGLSLLATFFPVHRRSAFWIFFIPALLANGLVAAWRYHQAWPMLPMYLGPVALPFCIGVLILFTGRRDPENLFFRRTVSALILMIAAAAVLFPKDYYLPFIKSKTISAHLFFFFGILGRGCFMVAAAWAVAGLSRHPEKQPLHTGSRTTPWIVWGFSFFTLSMFAGELWSYLGWGTPVIWDDPAITTTMATWFFYICWLHLHLTGSWSRPSRAVYAAVGALVVFALNCIPELGPFRWPFKL